jgi:hypothetical protein
MHAEELSRFFDRNRRDWEHLWNRLVDIGDMSEQTREMNLIRADEIGALLRTIAEGQAVLTYPQPPQREPSPMIWLPRAAGNDA